MIAHFEDIKLEEAMKATRTHKCPLPYALYVPECKNTRSTRIQIDNKLFGRYDSTNIKSVRAALMAEEAKNLGIVGVKRVQGGPPGALPEPVDIEETLSNKMGSTYTKW